MEVYANGNQQMSTQQRNDALIEKNAIQAGPMRPLTLETVNPVCNFTLAKTAIVFLYYLHFNV